MSKPNPYESPQSSAEARTYPPGTLTLSRALGFVLLSAAIFAGLGMLLGLVIGVALPEYYEQLFNLPSDGRAVTAGMVLGLMQGGGAGVAVGLVLAAIIAWLQVRLQTIAMMRASR